MLADAMGVMPDALKIEADQHFFESGLDAADLVVHGRHSHERQSGLQLRRRLIVTQQISTIAADPSEENAFFWNPGGMTFEEAMTALGMPGSSVAVSVVRLCLACPRLL